MASANEIIIPLNDHINIKACLEKNPGKPGEFPDEIDVVFENTRTGEIQDIAAINPHLIYHPENDTVSFSSTHIDCRIFADDETEDPTQQFCIKAYDM